MKASLYHETTGQFVPEEVIPTEQDATIAQLETNWRSHPITAKFFKELKEEETSLINSSISLATTYHSHNNHQQIINNLIRVDQLRKLKEKYA